LPIGVVLLRAQPVALRNGKISLTTLSDRLMRFDMA
jgi:hypothetical protein